MNREIILKTIIFCIVIFQSLLFIPEHILKNYNIIGYSVIIGLVAMLNALSISKEQTITQILYDSSLYISILIPLAMLLYINIKYKKIIDKSADHVSNYTTLKTLSTLLLMLQTYGISHYILYEKSTNMLLGVILSSFMILFISGLLWVQVRFFVTDGFTIK